MADLSIKAGNTSETIDVFIQDATKTNGGGLTGLVFNSSGLTCYYNFPKGTSTALSLATLAAVTSAWSSGGFKEIDATNAPGKYRLDVSNAMIASGNGRYVEIMLRGATNMVDKVVKIGLTGLDDQSTTDGGLSKLTSLTYTVANKIDANVYTWNGTAVATPATAGIPDVNIKNIVNVAATLDANNVLNVSTKYWGGTLIVATSIPVGTAAGAAGGLLISGANSGTTTFNALTVTNAFTVSGSTVLTGNVSMAAGLTVTQSTLNGAGISVAGNGTGAGISSTGGATGQGALFVGGGTSGPGISVTTTSGDGLSLTPTAGHAITATGQGTTKHGINASGGAVTSHGISATGGGVGHGILATSGGGATGDGIKAIAASTNGSGLELVKTGTGSDLLATTTTLVMAKTTNITGFNDILATAIVSAGAITTSAGAVAITSNIKKNQALAKFAFVMTDSTLHTPKTGLTVTVTRSIDGGAFGAGTLANVTEIANGTYTVDLGAGDLNGNVIMLRATAALADDVGIQIITQP